jgi:acyl carrier protein phosphodiesterase
MNFLGHIYFSDNDPELMYANLFGDFVKGSDLSNFPTSIKKGIILHRSIDNYIDHHPDVVDLMHQLYPSLPKITGIAVDLYFDHLLASNWNNYHPTDYRSYLNKFYSYSIEKEPAYPESYKSFIRILKQKDWMIHYNSREGLKKMCNGVSQRISFSNALSFAPNIFERKEKIITETFEKYMTSAIPFFSELRSRL